MTISLSLAVRNTRAQAVADHLDGAATAGKFQIYTAPRPASGAAITTQILLGTCTLSDPCGTVSGGVLTFGAISDDVSADADGDIFWVRATDGEGVWVMDMSAGLTGSGAEIIFNTLTTRIGGAIQIQSGELVEGGA